MRVFSAIAISVGMLAAGARSQTSNEQGAIRITRSRAQPPQSAPADQFIGNARLDSSFESNAPARMSAPEFVFETGARTAWHTHSLGQLLIVTAGTGRVQRWGDPVDEIRQGDVVWIPPGQKHWHGAAPNSAMTHTAIAEMLDGKAVDWMELVSDAQYNAPLRGRQRRRTPPRGRDRLKLRSARAPRPQSGPDHRRHALRRHLGAIRTLQA